MLLRALSASFQRTDGKDGVMLLGVSKTLVGEDNGKSLISLSVIITLHKCLRTHE